MDFSPLTTPSKPRLTRAEQKQETRDALVVAGLVAFSRDGYHGASLEAIANEAGYSKGAVYSNFGGKAELFLAVMDFNLSALRGADWDPVTAGSDTQTPDPSAMPEGAAEIVRGIGLATLEFITTAARDDALLDALRSRTSVLLGAYGRVAAAHRQADDDLPVDDVAQLMVALDQGSLVLALLSGTASMDGTLLRTGMRRLLQDTAADPASTGRAETASLTDIERVRHLLQEMDDDQPRDD